jgi:hypothetical protein
VVSNKRLNKTGSSWISGNDMRSGISTEPFFYQLESGYSILPFNLYTTGTLVGGFFFGSLALLVPENEILPIKTEGSIARFLFWGAQ